MSGIDHVSLSSADYDVSRAFYEKALAPLGLRTLIVATVTVASADRAMAVGLEGAQEALWRVDARTALGWDNVGGYDSAGYGYGEVSGRFELNRQGLYLGMLLSSRGDYARRDYAIDDGAAFPGWAFVAQPTVGYEGERLHLSIGPWFYAEKRRNPELRLRAIDLAELAATQGAILEAAARLVRPGGRLVYATCSVLAAENEDIAAAFLSYHREFEPDGELTLLPHRDGTDGFYAIRLRRSRSGGTELR